MEKVRMHSLALFIQNSWKVRLFSAFKYHWWATSHIAFLALFIIKNIELIEHSVRGCLGTVLDFQVSFCLVSCFVVLEIQYLKREKQDALFEALQKLKEGKLSFSMLFLF